MVVELLDDEQMATPIYFTDINSAEEADQFTKAPLICFWNEKPLAKGTSFELSINSRIVSERLETVLSRERAEFEIAKALVIGGLRHIFMDSVHNTCELLDAGPSQIFEHGQRLEIPKG